MPELHPFVSGKWRTNIPPSLPVQQWFDNGASFGYATTNKIESIFLGTFPSYEVVNLLRHNGNKEFFYGSVDNGFWRLLELITGLPINTEHQLFQLLTTTGFGVTDILRKIDRRGRSSSDKGLTPALFNDIIDLKNQFPAIANIYTTSGGKGKITNGTSVSAAKWLMASLNHYGYTVTEFNQPGFQKHICVLLNGNTIWNFNLVSLWSPSRNANTAVQRSLNSNATFRAVVNSIPAPYTTLLPTQKARLVQWSYLLGLNGFPIVPQLSATIAPHRAFLATMFA